MKVIKIGIAPQAKIRERMLAIAKGEFKPKASDPKIWSTSMHSLSQVLSDPTAHGVLLAQFEDGAAAVLGHTRQHRRQALQQ